jgi:hypothetical protein
MSCGNLRENRPLNSLSVSRHRKLLIIQKHYRTASAFATNRQRKDDPVAQPSAPRLGQQAHTHARTGIGARLDSSHRAGDSRAANAEKVGDLLHGLSNLFRWPRSSKAKGKT